MSENLSLIHIISHGTYLQMNIDNAMHIYQSKPAQILQNIAFEFFNILRSLELCMQWVGPWNQSLIVCMQFKFGTMQMWFTCSNPLHACMI